MRAAPGLFIEWVEDEAVILDPTSNQVHYLNPTAALAYALIEEKGYEQALAELRIRFGAESDFESAVEALMEELIEKGLLID